MEGTTWLDVAGPNIVHEDFGDEMVIVNLNTGKYYAFTPTAADLWLRLQGGASIESLVAGTLATFAGDPAQMKAQVLTFLQQLLAEALVGIDPAPTGTGATSPAATGEKRPFAAPAFEVFTDMEDLLLLDPIHDVDESGWPNPPISGE